MKIGDVQLASPFVLAPLAGVSDSPFRQLAREQGAAAVYTEMVSSDGLVRGNKMTMDYIAFEPHERPIGVQLFGSDPAVMADATRVLSELPPEQRPDLIDINMGCPVRKVVTRNAGAALLQDVPLIERIVSAMASVSSLPVTAKELDALESYQFTFDFDTEKLEFLGVLNCDLANFGFKHLAEGGINHLWLRPKNQPVAANSTIFNLLFKAKKDGNLSGSVGVSSQFVEAAAYKLDMDFEEKLPIRLSFTTPETPTTTGVSAEGSAPVFYGISPNPMVEKAVATFNLAQNGAVKLTLTESTGRLIFSEKREFSSGFGQFPIEIEPKGVFFYKIEMADGVFTGRLISH